MKQLLWYLLAGTRGGPTRIMIIDAIRNKPQNAHQLAQLLKLDYKTVQHHLKVLVENNIFSVVKKGEYGATYFLSAEFEANKEHFEHIRNHYVRS